ncbi:MAG: signal peptidase I [Epulopiscium sp.]|nr:signal peptidase I [Candidatus Epulonipiscium sp.]
MKTDKKILKSLNKKPKTLFFWRGYILDWVIDIAIAGLIVYIITTFAFQNMYVAGNSMSPTFKNGETVLINKLTYLIKTPERHDIVTFRHLDPEKNEISIVKRIFGIPGDEIKIINGNLYINNEMLDLPDIDPGNMHYPIIVPKDSYFVLGDNCGESMDSRHKEIGLVSENNIEGKIFMKVWPFWKMEFYR